MAQFAIMGVGAVFNAVAFTGLSSLFSMLSLSETEICNKALTQVQIDWERWNEKQAQLTYLASEELQWQGHALQSFKNTDEALEEYHSLTNIDLEANLRKEPNLSDYYTPSDSTKQAEIIGIIMGMLITGFVAYKYGHSNWIDA